MSKARPTGKRLSSSVARAFSLPVDKLLRALLHLDPLRRVSILDSCGARPPDARFLIAGFDPFEIAEARASGLYVFRPREAERKGEREGELLELDVLEFLDQRLAAFHTPQSSLNAAAAPTAGACVATFSYDLARRYERLRFTTPRTDTHEPDAVLAFYDTLVTHDYLSGTTTIASVAGPQRLEEAADALSEAAARAEQAGHFSEQDFQDALLHQAKRKVVSNFTRDEYLSAVRLIKEYIAAGDIYQANLTQQLSLAIDAGRAPEEVFLRLRRDHPAAFAAFVRRREDTVISASPERFLRVNLSEQGRTVEAWPIKGTRPRGRNAEEDARLRSELAASSKDRAENVMIVDLLRNDLGRVCRYGTVAVEELFTVQEHPTLFHLVSKVRGSLREDVTAGALLRAAFPCGSITGAPKLRAMEILDQIERTPRGLSMGAIGYFSFDGTADLSVAIRTMTVHEKVARFNVGGGIVADSQPDDEYEESLTKARALLDALNAELKGKDEG